MERAGASRSFGIWFVLFSDQRQAMWVYFAEKHTYIWGHNWHVSIFWFVLRWNFDGRARPVTFECFERVCFCFRSFMDLCPQCSFGTNSIVKGSCLLVKLEFLLKTTPFPPWRWSIRGKWPHGRWQRGRFGDWRWDLPLPLGVAMAIFGGHISGWSDWSIAIRECQSWELDQQTWWYY
jgi:hypothetical protein